MNTVNYSPKEIQIMFNELMESHSRLKELDGDAYYEYQSVFKKDLRAFLRTDFRTLRTNQLLLLISMVSTHRPVEPFSFLITCSNLIAD